MWTAEEPLAFAPDQIGLKGSPTMVFKTQNPEKHPQGEMIKVTEVGVETAVKSALEKVVAANILSAVDGGVK